MRETASINVLHVDDDPDFIDLAATYLEREDERIRVHPVTDPKEGFAVLDDQPIDCIVSDYDMSQIDGIEFLETVRETYPDLPFILYTGKGSEEVASDAISAGVSDYLQKEGGTDQYEVLANRITNLVNQHRAEAKVEEYDQAQTESERYRQQLAGIIADPDQSVDQKIERLLALGCDRFGVENGHLVMIDEATGRHEVISTYGSDIVEKGVSDLSNTYCRRTIESDEILDVYHATEQGWEGDPAYESFGLACYIGGKLTADGRLFGTLCFADTVPREPFTHNEKAFFDLLRQWFNRTLERRQRLNQADVIFEHTQDALFLIDVWNDGRFTIRSVNRAYEELTGLSTDDLRGQTPRDVLGDKQGGEVEARYRECIEAQAPIEYDEQLTLGGDTKYWYTRLAPVIEDGNVTQLVGATRDITDRKEYEQQLREEQQFVHSIFRSLPDPLYAFDTDGHPIRWNEKFEEVTGYSGGEIEDMSVTEFVPEAETETIAENFRTILDERRAVTVESAFETKAGDRIPHEFTGGPLEDADGSIRGVTGIGRDITERQDHERRLHALNRATRELLTADTREEVAEMGVEVAQDLLDLEATAIHLYDEDASGLVPVAVTDPVIELIGEPPTFTGEDSIAWRVYQQGESLTVDDIHTDSDIFNPDTPAQSELFLPIAEYGILLATSMEERKFDERDVILGEVLTANITTALIQVERREQLRARERELTQQNERLEEFASVVSHDLRNPLNVIAGRLELIREDCDSEHLDAIERAYNRMDTLIDDLLTLAREGDTVTDTSPVDLVAIVEECWTTVDTADASLVTDIDRSIAADESRLKQVFENLIRNAIEHGVEDVTITVGELHNGFYIEDDGPGIPAEKREDVFEAGYSTTETGTGFGLRIVKQVIEAHGWRIHLTEGSDGGARFEITGVEDVDP
ncbi:MAG: PAS domain S-box protein [Halobacteriales archaeon]